MGALRIRAVAIRPRRPAGKRASIRARSSSSSRISAARVLLEVGDPLASRKRHDVVAAREQPRQRQLRRRRAAALREGAQLGDQREVVLDVARIEARDAAAQIVFAQTVGGAHRAGEQSPAQRRVRDERDVQLACRRQHAVRLDIAREQRVLALQGRDRNDARRATKRPRVQLRNAGVAHLAGRDELGQRAGRLLDRNPRVGAVQIIHVDVIDTEPLQRGLAGRADVLGPAVAAAKRRIGGAAHHPAFRRHDRRRTAIAQRAPDEPLVLAAAVHVGRVDQRHPELERAVDRARRLAFGDGIVELRHPHAAQPDRADLRAVRAESPCVHRRCLRCVASAAKASRALRYEPIPSPVKRCTHTSRTTEILRKSPSRLSTSER